MRARVKDVMTTRVVAVRSGASYLEMAALLRTYLPRFVLGSVASRLLHMATRPVLIVPRTDTHAEPAESSAVAAAATT